MSKKISNKSYQVMVNFDGVEIDGIPKKLRTNETRLRNSLAGAAK